MSVAKEMMRSILEGKDVRTTLSKEEFMKESKEQIMDESVAGMTEEEKDQLDALLKEWGVESGTNGWDFLPVRYASDIYAIKLKKNPVASFRAPVFLEKDGDILNVEVYFEPSGEYLSSSGSCSLNGLKAALRDLSSQEQTALEEYEEEINDPNYGIA